MLQTKASFFYTRDVIHNHELFFHSWNNTSKYINFNSVNTKQSKWEKQRDKPKKKQDPKVLKIQKNFKKNFKYFLNFLFQKKLFFRQVSFGSDKLQPKNRIPKNIFQIYRNYLLNKYLIQTLSSSVLLHNLFPSLLSIFLI